MADIKMTSHWSGGFTGQGEIKGDGWSTVIGIPTELGGSGAGANPKELFTAATLACFTATLRAITEKKKLPVDDIAVETTAEAEGDAFAIRHLAKVTLAPGATETDRAAAEGAIEAADKHCTVGNLAKKAGVTIEITPAVTVPA